jgi:hypothetical protein
VPRKPLIDLEEAWGAVDYLFECGAFRNPTAVKRMKRRIRLEAQRRWFARRKKGEARETVP